MNLSYSHRIDDWGAYWDEVSQRVGPHGAGVGELAFYCQNPSCIARQITIRIKWMGENTPDCVCCPLCQTSRNLRFTHIMNREEKRRDSEETLAATLAGALLQDQGMLTLGGAFITVGLEIEKILAIPAVHERLRAFRGFLASEEERILEEARSV